MMLKNVVVRKNHLNDLIAVIFSNFFKVYIIMSNQTSNIDLIIITPCSRPYNLDKLYNSIDFNKITLWCIIYDTRHMEFIKRYSNNPKIIELECKEDGIAGHQIRNYALHIITKGMLYFLDDDNIIHPFFWHLIDHFKYGNLYTFNLLYQNGKILYGNNPTPPNIDTSQYVFDRSIVKDIKFELNNYAADGIFINTLYENNKSNTFYFNYIAAYYNWLNKEQPLPL